MPATVKKIGNKWRVVEADGTIVKNKSGTPVDGAGHATHAQAVRQARAINAHQQKR